MATREPDAVALLKQDHAAVKALFKEFEETEEEDAQQELAERICRMLTVHATIEEELLYPAAHQAFSGDEEDEELVHEAEIEHATAKQLIAEIEGMSPADEKYCATVKVLSEYINHHVKEEEGELFPKLKKTDVDLQEIGAELHQRKMELMSEMGMSEEMEEDEDEEQPKRSRGGQSQGEHQRARGHSSRSSSRRSSSSGRGGSRSNGGSRRSARSRH